MKLKDVKKRESGSRGHTVAVALSVGLLFCFGQVLGAQLRAQKRITAVWTATSAEGSRVTVASDSQLNDYEAYTRDNRFYVKIPLADLPSTTGSLLGRGFDDAHIQRAGDGILLSFRLQPATTARVDQKVNHIEIVFSIPMRPQISASNVARPKAEDRSRARTIPDRISPTPSISIGEEPTSRRAFDRHGSTAKGATSSAIPSPSASPILSPSSAASASTSPLLTAASHAGTPLAVAAPAQQATGSASPTVVTANDGNSDWSSRFHYYKTWARLNPLPLAIGGLTFLALSLLLFVKGGRKRRSVRTAPSGEKLAAFATVPGAAAPVRPNPKPAISNPAGAIAGKGGVEVPSRNSVGSPVVDKAAYASEDPEREVFEL